MSHRTQEFIDFQRGFNHNQTRSDSKEYGRLSGDKIIFIEKVGLHNLSWDDRKPDNLDVSGRDEQNLKHQSPNISGEAEPIIRSTICNFLTFLLTLK